MADNKIEARGERAAEVISSIGIIAVVGLVVFLLITSCGVQKPIIEYRDSIVYRDRIVRDTAVFEVPVEVEKIVTRDTASHLVNSFGYSDAVVSGGFLSHSLVTRPQTIKIPVEVPVHDTITVHTEAQTVIKEVKVEKPLSWWQRLKIGAFWWLVALCVVGWRRELLALGKKLIKLIAI